MARKRNPTKNRECCQMIKNNNAHGLALKFLLEGDDYNCYFSIYNLTIQKKIGEMLDDAVLKFIIVIILT